MEKPINQLHVKNLVKSINIFTPGTSSTAEIKEKVNSALLDAMSEALNPVLPNSTGNRVKEIHTTHVDVIDVKIEACTLQEILEIITKEFEKCHHLHHFSGHLLGFARSVPTVSFETEKEPRCSSLQ